jgi:hypothetical protein
MGGLYRWTGPDGLPHGPAAGSLADRATEAWVDGGVIVGELVNVDSFNRAETDRMFAALLGRTGGLGLWRHDRQLGALDEQTVIRQNRDTLYSIAVVDISEGATLTLPDGGDRYVSAMIVNQDHYINAVLHEPGEHRLTVADHETPYVLVGVRILVDPSDPDDLAVVHALQDQLALTSGSSIPFRVPDRDEASLTATREALLELAKGVGGFDRAFGSRAEVDPVRHLLGTAAGWGGLPQTEASYVNVNPGLPVGSYSITLRDVPADAFWSVSVYNAAGFFEENDRGAYNVNSVGATPNGDGSITVSFGGCDDGAPNCLPIVEGWNFLIRLYRPRPEALDGTWAVPPVEERSAR